MRVLSLAFAGILFAVGLVVGGMTLPAKVINFLDVTGDWDPSLLFVMGGAAITYGILFRVFTKRDAPVYGERFRIPTRRDMPPRLFIGSAMFGAGWGLAGFCPGPGLVSAAALSKEALIFVPAMLIGMWVFGIWENHHESKRASAGADSTSSNGASRAPTMHWSANR